MSNYVVVARFDDKTTEKLNTLRKNLYEDGFIKAISNWPPHITIAAYEGVDINALLQWTGEYVNRHLYFDIMANTPILPFFLLLPRRQRV